MSESSLSPPNELHGWSVDVADPIHRSTVLSLAFDYRGDVTLELTTGEKVAGYLYRYDSSVDRVEVLVPGQDKPRRTAASQILRVRFSGKDAAAGRSWQAWLEKVAEAEAKGEIAELYPEQH